MTDHILDHDTQAILLLCGRFGRAQTEEYKPLKLREYNRLAQWLSENSLRPGDLLHSDRLEQLEIDYPVGANSHRIQHLLSRGAAMALAVESWANRGIWVISRTENAYPNRLQRKLKRSAPPILYGTGNHELLTNGGLAIVGSRDVDHEGMQFTVDLAHHCATENIQIISGGARGVDSDAMVSVLSHGGSTVGVLAHSLSRAAVSGKYRDYIMEGNLVLLSAYDPDAGFSVGAAMGRNKYIYCLSDWALVVSTGLGKGGTWNGARENIKHKWIPLFVRSGPSIPEGNSQLLQQGGIPMPDSIASDRVDLRTWLTEHGDQVEGEENDNHGQQLPLFPDRE